MATRMSAKSTTSPTTQRWAWLLLGSMRRLQQTLNLALHGSSGMLNTKSCMQEGKVDGRPHSMCVYTPSRTVAVYALADTCDARADDSVLGIPGLGVKDRGPFFER